MTRDGSRVDIAPDTHLGVGAEEEGARVAPHPGGLLVHAAVVVVVVTRICQVRVERGARDGSGARLDAGVILLGPLGGRRARLQPGFAPLVTLDEPAQEMVKKWGIVEGLQLIFSAPTERKITKKTFTFTRKSFLLLAFFLPRIRFECK